MPAFGRTVSRGWAYGLCIMDYITPTVTVTVGYVAQLLMSDELRLDMRESETLGASFLRRI
jgi:hypothetical protein